MKVTGRMKKRQFSLLEIIIAISIVALIAAIAVPNLLQDANEASVNISKTEMGNIKGKIIRYRLKNGKFPATLADLNKSGETLKDPWGNEYQYEVTSEGFEIMSFGNDGQSGGEGVNADIKLIQDRN
jgi:general secretion pathway protein G